MHSVSTVEPKGLMRIGKYQLVKLIKSGDVTEVYEAIEDGVDAPVAIKLLRPSQNKLPLVVKRFRREAMTAVSLHHDNIVPLYDIGHENGTHFYVMKRIRGLSLGEIRKMLTSDTMVNDSNLMKFLKQFQELDFVLDKAKQILKALSYAHEQGIVHRDLKPSNLMIDYKGKAWISDFGTVKLTEGIAENLTTTGCKLGNFRYASPELICADEEECGAVDNRSDLYSFAAVFFDFFTGQVPSRKTSEFSQELCAGTIAEFPESIHAILSRAGHPDADKRFQSADELKRALASYDSFSSGQQKPSLIMVLLGRFTKGMGS